MEASPIINRVTNSALISLDLEGFYPQGERILYDIKENLFQGLILREKEFRGFIASYDWEKYKDKYVAIHCSADAIVPTWAYMLLASKLSFFARKVIFGNLQELENSLFQDALKSINLDSYKDAKVVVKGCSKVAVPEFAYVEIVQLLQPVAASIMYGEPCSTVPIFKRPKDNNIVSL